MALITCPECGQQVSDRAAQCIHCGCPLSKEEKTGPLFCVALTWVNPAAKVKVVGFLRELMGTGPSEANQVVSNIPVIVAHDLTRAEAESLQRRFASVDASVDIISEDELRKAKMEEAAKNTVTCPRCGSTAITTGKRGYSIVTGFLGSGKTVNRCGNCGYKWEPRR